MAIRGLRRAAEAAVPLLVEVLKNGDVETRLQTIIALGEIGPGAIAAVPELRKLLQDQDVSLQMAAKDAIDKIEE